MKIVAGMPSSRAAQATAWPWLPALAATTPAARSAGVSVASLLTAPRILNEPVRWRFSALSADRRPVSRAERLRVVDGRHARVLADPLPGGLDVSERRFGLRRQCGTPCGGSRGPRSAGRARGAAPRRGAAGARRRLTLHFPDAGGRVPRRPNTPRPRGCARGAPRARRRPRDAALCAGDRCQSSSTPSPRSASVSTIGGGCRPRASICRTSVVVVARERMVALVDRDHVRDLHDPGLERLDRVARAGHQHEHDRVGDREDADLALARADRLEEDDVLSGRVEQRAPPGASPRRGRPRGRASPSSG